MQQFSRARPRAHPLSLMESWVAPRKVPIHAYNSSGAFQSVHLVYMSQGGAVMGLCELRKNLIAYLANALWRMYMI
jgi:hypothetical protein